MNVSLSLTNGVTLEVALEGLLAWIDHGQETKVRVGHNVSGKERKTQNIFQITICQDCLFWGPEKNMKILSVSESGELDFGLLPVFIQEEGSKCVLFDIPDIQKRSYQLMVEVDGNRIERITFSERPNDEEEDSE